MAAKASKNCNVPQIQKMKKTPQNATFSKTQIRMKPKICCKTWNNLKTLGAMKKKKQHYTPTQLATKKETEKTPNTQNLALKKEETQPYKTKALQNKQRQPEDH